MTTHHSQKWKQQLSLQQEARSPALTEIIELIPALMEKIDNYDENPIPITTSTANIPEGIKEETFTDSSIYHNVIPRIWSAS